jgi:serine phosphatase RsbU (regulator of sigma subunit)
MTDQKLTIKPHATLSLSQRVVLIILCLLVIPLFLHSILLYRQEYAEKVGDTKVLLQAIVEGQKALFEDKMKLQWLALDAAAQTPSSPLAQNFHMREIAAPPGFSGSFARLLDHSIIVGKVVSGNRAIAIESPLDTSMSSRFTFAPYPISVALVSSSSPPVLSNVLTVQLPLSGTDFSVLGSIPEASIVDLHRSHYVYHFLSLLFFIGVIGGSIVYLLTRRVAQPLNALCSAMDRVGQGALHVRYEPDRMGFEINTLGKQFNQMLDSLLHHQSEAEKQRLQRERLAEELRIGHEIQKSLLPAHLPEFKGAELATGFLPAKEVGGDFYDFCALADGSIFIAIADAAGKGVSACLYSLGLRSALRSLALMTPDLSEIVLKANNLFWEDAKQSGMFITAWVGIYNPADRSLIYCTQGHPPAFLLRKNKIEELWTPGIALGASTIDAAPTKKTTLLPGDLLLLYTDGIVEAHDRNDKLYGSTKLREVLLQSQQLSVDKIVHRLFEKVGQFAKDVPQHDDMTLLLMRILD